jgi:hypothetical protein
MSERESSHSFAASRLCNFAIICGMENKRDIPYGVINWATLARECLFVEASGTGPTEA